MGFFPERKGNARKIISRVSEKRSTDLTLFIPFLLVYDYLFDDPTSLEYIYARVSRYFLLYIRGKSYGPSIFKNLFFRTAPTRLIFAPYSMFSHQSRTKILTIQLYEIYGTMDNKTKSTIAFV